MSKNDLRAAKAILPTPETTSAVDADEQNDQQTAQQEVAAEKAVAPASIRPATEAISAPEPAANRPASQVASVPKAVMGKSVALTDAPFDIPQDPTAFLQHGEEVAQEMIRKVPCQIVKDLKGCIGVGLSFEFKRGQSFLIPKWFALSHPSSIVIKE